MRFKKTRLALALSAILCLTACESNSNKNETISPKVSESIFNQKDNLTRASASLHASDFDNLVTKNQSECYTNGKIEKQNFYDHKIEFRCQNGSWQIQDNIKSIIQNLNKEQQAEILADLKISEDDLYAIISSMQEPEKKSSNEQKVATGFKATCSAQKEANEWHYTMRMNIGGQLTTTTVSYKFNESEVVRTETLQVKFDTFAACDNSKKDFEQNNEEGSFAKTECSEEGILTSSISTKSNEINEASKKEIYQEVTSICDEGNGTEVTFAN